MTEPGRLWIDDNPFALERVAEFLRARSGSPFCDLCIARALALSTADVRRAVTRLVTAGHCEQGLWWCSACATKASVALSIPGMWA